MKPKPTVSEKIVVAILAVLAVVALVVAIVATSFFEGPSVYQGF
jgi:hypothetical protein